MSSIILSDIICSESICALEAKITSLQLPRSLSLPFLNMGTTFAIIQAEEPPSDWIDLLKKNNHVPGPWFHGPVLLACWRRLFPSFPGLNTVSFLKRLHLACNYCPFSMFITISPPDFAPHSVLLLLEAKYSSCLELCKFTFLLCTASTSGFFFVVFFPLFVSFPLQGLTQFDLWQFSLHPCSSWPPKTYLSLLLNLFSKAALMCRQLSRAAGCWGVIKGP